MVVGRGSGACVAARSRIHQNRKHRKHMRNSGLRMATVDTDLCIDGIGC